MEARTLVETPVTAYPATQRNVPGMGIVYAFLLECARFDVVQSVVKHRTVCQHSATQRSQ